MTMNLDLFPPINATLNGLAFLCLTAGYFFIRFRNDQATHRRFMIGAFALSAVFLATYLTYHYLKAGVHTRFPGTGFFLYFYYAMLISHVLLAMINLPLILVTFWLAAKRRFIAHRKWARWTFPIWYYVSVTGVLVYFFLYHWFPGERA
jgi:putative membrane protein